MMASYSGTVSVTVANVMADTTACDSTWRSWTSAATSASTALYEFADAISSAASGVASAWTQWNDALTQTVRVREQRSDGTWTEWVAEERDLVDGAQWLTFTSTRAALLNEEETLRIQSEVIERETKKAEALQRANDLLMMCLSGRQRSDWRKHSFFEVRSQSGKTFRITNGYSMNVHELDENGRAVRTHCIVPKGVEVPVPDQLLMQKLMLETNEAEFMRVANHRTA